MPRLQVSTKARSKSYEIRIGRGLLAKAGSMARNCLGKDARRIGLISNHTVFSLYGDVLKQSLEASGFVAATYLMGDGERYKTLLTANRAVRFLSDTNLDRGDGVLALGGGVVGDVAGFVSSIYLRGVPFIQVPTTLLAQIDSSVGGKTGVNLPSGKNLVGAYHPPTAVISDVETLRTLPARELVAGWCETVKQGAVGSRRLFDQTARFLKQLSARDVLVSSQLEEIIASHCAFKASIASQDEREDPARRDHRSRRILNFGHTIGHALETVTGYRHFRHGEAVGQGMLVAATLSKNVGLLAQTELELLREAIGLCGQLPAAHDLDESAVIAAITHDKKRTHGRVQWILLERIGRARLVDGKEISASLLRQSMRDAWPKPRRNVKGILGLK